MRSLVLTLAAAAFALRLGCALVTEFKPLFPAYYYTDAAVTDSLAAAQLERWRGGEKWVNSDRAQRGYATLVAALYAVFGRHELVPKAFNCAAAALGVAALAAAAAPVFGWAAALVAAGMTALWPSHMFYTSQNFKEPLIFLFCWLGLWASAEGRRSRRLSAAAAALAGLALLRPVAAGALALAWAAALAERLPKAARAAAFALAGAAALAAVPAISGAVTRALIVPSDPRYASVVPGTPQALSDIRRLRQEANESFAADHDHDVGTPLFADLRFTGWTSVAAFVPRGAFAVLFQPLPGLYPTQGKPGRILACAENSALLLLAMLAVLGLARGRYGAGAAAFLAFFAVMTTASAFSELDLGGASRHKIVYLPALFPFAAAALRRKRQPSAGKLKVFEVLECGGPGGTGNQVAALCNGLDPARFDVSLVYAVRPGASAEEYRARASGAKQAFYVPEMVRPISPLSDARAFLKLYRLFKDQRPDVVHAHSSKAGVLARWAACFAGVPRVFYTPHGYGFLQQDHSPLKRALYRLIERASSPIGTIVAVSQSEAELARALTGADRVETINDPFLGELPASVGPAPHDGLRVGACGRITAARNPDAFVNLAQRLTDSRNGVTCVWIGGGEGESAMRRHLENMNLAGRMDVTGWLSGEEARHRLAGLDVLVHYSRWDGLPNAVLEAMAQGIPVVASDAPGARDAVVDGQTGFIARTEIELLERTLKLLDDPSLRRKLGQAGRRRVESDFRLDRALARLSELYAGA